MSARRLLSLVGLVTALAGCSSLPLICEPEHARSAGKSRAMQGQQADLSVGQACQGEHHATFREQYQAGYRDGLAQLCNVDEIAKRPYSVGEEGTRLAFPESSYQVCENITELRAAFQRANREGIAAFCTPTKAAEAGRLQGEAGRAPQFEEAHYAVCEDAKSALKAAYLTAQKAGLERFCRADAIEAQGEETGRQGVERLAVSERYETCPIEARERIQSRYNRAYENGLTHYCETGNLRPSAMSQARNVNNARFPEEFRVCLGRFPELATRFEILFREARQQVVEGECTYARGQDQGNKDAETGNLKKTDLPGFCNANLFSVYLSGYLEAWKTTKDRLCSANEAYETGMRDANYGYRLDYQAPTLCPTEYHAPLFQKYREGYHFIRLQAKNKANPTVGSPTHGSDNSTGKRPAYSKQRAQETCLRKGYADYQCEDVTSLACIEMGHSPFLCDIQSDYMAAVDVCIRRGHTPVQCEDVKDIRCIQSGKSPMLCQEPETRIVSPSFSTDLPDID